MAIPEDMIPDEEDNWVLQAADFDRCVEVWDCVDMFVCSHTLFLPRYHTHFKKNLTPLRYITITYSLLFTAYHRTIFGMGQGFLGIWDGGFQKVFYQNEAFLG